MRNFFIVTYLLLVQLWFELTFNFSVQQHLDRELQLLREHLDLLKLLWHTPPGTLLRYQRSWSLILYNIHDWFYFVHIWIYSYQRPNSHISATGNQGVYLITILGIILEERSSISLFKHISELNELYDPSWVEIRCIEYTLFTGSTSLNCNRQLAIGQQCHFSNMGCALLHYEFILW